MGVLLSTKAVKTLREIVATVRGLQPHPTLKQKLPTTANRSIAWLGKVVGIDIETLGAGRKLLAVQPITVYPFLSEGPLVFVDGGIDSQIVCGCEVLVFRVRHIDGWPDSQYGNPPDSSPPPSFFGLPLISVDQRNIDEPDPTVVVTVVDPALPLVPSLPCVAP